MLLRRRHPQATIVTIILHGGSVLPPIGISSKTFIIPMHVHFKFWIEILC